MFDLAIVASLQLPLPPEPPQMVQERVWLARAGNAAQRLADRAVADYTAYVDDWIERMHKSASAYHLIEAGFASRPALAELDDIIEETETTAEWRSKERTKMAKKAVRRNKKLFAAEPSLGAVSKALSSQLRRQDDRIIEAILDHALFLRSVRAERDQDNAPHPVFDDPDVMMKHLLASVS